MLTIVIIVLMSLTILLFSMLVLIAEWIQHYAQISLKYHPLPKPTCQYYDLHAHNPFSIVKSNIVKLSGLFKVFLVKLTNEMLEAIDVYGQYGHGVKMFGHESSKVGVNFFLDGLFVVTRDDSGFELTECDKRFCKLHYKKLRKTFDLFQAKVNHATKCTE